MRNSMNWFSLILAALFLVACAEDRPIDRKPDPDSLRYAKWYFTGHNSDGSFYKNNKNGSTWLSKVTVTKTSTNGGFAFTGLQSDMKAGYFEFTKDQLRYYSAVNPFKSGGAGEDSIINSWNIKHSEFRLRESDGKVSNSEEEDKFKSYKNKRFFTVDWSRLNLAEGTSFPYTIGRAMVYGCFVAMNKSLVDDSTELSHDHISFTVEVQYLKLGLCALRNAELRRINNGDFTYTVQYKYSFRRLEKTNYQPYYYTEGFDDPLMKKYGYFQTVTEKLADKDGVDFKTQLLMNRWDPNKTHTFYFAADYPQEWKWMFNDPKIGIIKKTNDLFKRNGLKIRFDIKDADNDHKFGDSRYSFIKLIPEIDPGAPLGYGPSDTNPFTGEVVAANTMLWTGYLNYYLRRIKDTLDHEKDRYGKSSIFQHMKSTLEEEDHTKWTYTAAGLSTDKKAGKYFHDLLPDFTYGVPFWSRFSAHEGRFQFPSDRAQDVYKNRDDQPIVKIDSRFTQTEYNELVELISDNRSQAVKAIEDVRNFATESFSEHVHMHPRDTTIYEIDSALAEAASMLIDGVSAQQVLDTVMYRVAIHEFGHNLSLRHNFYGSVDKQHFHKPVKVIDRHGKPVYERRYNEKTGQFELVLKDGKPIQKWTEPVTSSVMEYVSLRDELYEDFEWGQYDEAALVYAYSGGKKDLSRVNKTRYLFCTDEHRPLNAYCNTWDHGSTPSEVIMSLIETYEDLYRVLNLRYGRAYWNTGGYTSRVFGVMYSMKKVMAAMRTGFATKDLTDRLGKMGVEDKAEIKEILDPIHEDFLQALKLSVAFYNSVIQQSSADRHYRHKYDEFTGELERVGIISDKIFAMLHLMGDMPIVYNPNLVEFEASYLKYLSDDTDLFGDFPNILDKVLENVTTVRVDMEPWFISFGRALFGMTAYNYRNLGNSQLIDRIRVYCFTPESFQKEFGIADVRKYVNPVKPDEEPDRLDSDLISLELIDAKHPDFQDNSKIGVIERHGNYYVAHEANNAYAYSVIWNMIQQPKRFGSSLNTAKDDVVEMYRLFNLFTQKHIPECK